MMGMMNFLTEVVQIIMHNVRKNGTCAILRNMDRVRSYSAVLQTIDITKSMLYHFIFKTLNSRHFKGWNFCLEFMTISAV